MDRIIYKGIGRVDLSVDRGISAWWDQRQQIHPAHDGRLDTLTSGSSREELRKWMMSSSLFSAGEESDLYSGLWLATCACRNMKCLRARDGLDEAGDLALSRRLERSDIPSLEWYTLGRYANCT